MKVVLVNGSPKREGNTAGCLGVIARELSKADIETEIICIGDKGISGCSVCGACRRDVGRGCVQGGEWFAETAKKIYAADGLIFATPTYYAGMNGTMKSFMDRIFYSSNARMRHKVAAGVAVTRRTGGMTAFQQLNAYFLISEMLIAPSFYWNVAYGSVPGDVSRDAEGVSIMQNLAATMAWMLKMKEQTQKTLPPPAPPAERPRTDFIR